MNASEAAQREAIRLGLQPGQLYRLAHSQGTHQARRVIRSLVVFVGAATRRQWDGTTVTCLEFTRPQGRPLSLLATQVVEARAAMRNELGQVMLMAEPHRSTRRRGGRRRVRRVA